MLFLRKCVLYESVVDAAVVVNLVNIVAFGLYNRILYLYSIRLNFRPF